MTGDANDAGGIHADLRLQHRWDFQQVVGGWVKEQKADGCSAPHQRNDPGLILEIPEPHPVVAVLQEVGNYNKCSGDTYRGEEQSPGPFANLSSSPSPKRGSTTVEKGKANY